MSIRELWIEGAGGLNPIKASKIWEGTSSNMEDAWEQFLETRSQDEKKHCYKTKFGFLYKGYRVYNNEESARRYFG